MKVILTQNVPGTGKKGEVLNVSDGFARNYLLPRGWAVEAKESAVRDIERKNAIEKKKEEERRAEAQELADSLKDKVIVVRAKAGEKGRLYGSVTNQEVTEALNEQYGLSIEKRKVELSDNIRTLGDYEAQVTVYSGIKAPMKVSIEQLK